MSENNNLNNYYAGIAAVSSFFLGALVVILFLLPGIEQEQEKAAGEKIIEKVEKGEKLTEREIERAKEIVDDSGEILGTLDDSGENSIEELEKLGLSEEAIENVKKYREFRRKIMEALAKDKREKRTERIIEQTTKALKIARDIDLERMQDTFLSFNELANLPEQALKERLRSLREQREATEEGTKKFKAFTDQLQNVVDILRER